MAERKHILLAAINAKYIHSNLAVYSLKAYAKKYQDQIGLAEYTINQNPDDILKGIYRDHPEVLCISCYIWNISYVRNLIREVHKVLPDTAIWLGGPEVSYDARKVLEEHPEKQICVIDSRAAAGTMVLLIRRAQALIEAAGDDGDFDALCQQLHRYQATLRTCFTLENFDNLIKNGRMRPIVGTLLRSLGIHIIADATAEGTIHVADKARGEGKTYRAITALMRQSKDCTGAEVVISHCENLAGAMKLKQQILDDLPVKSVDILSCRGLTSFYAMEKGLILGY